MVAAAFAGPTRRLWARSLDGSKRQAIGDAGAAASVGYVAGPCGRPLSAAARLQSAGVGVYSYTPADKQLKSRTGLLERRQQTEKLLAVCDRHAGNRLPPPTVEQAGRLEREQVLTAR